MSNELPKRVFISYSRKPDENRQRVRILADSLIRHGVHVVIDDYEPSPEETWPAWMKRQISESDYVLLVCTESYLKRAESDDLLDGRGVGYELKFITNAIYDAKQKNSKYIPVVFSPEESQFILEDVKGWSSYLLGSGPYNPKVPGGYQDLYRRITQQPGAVPPTLGEVVILPPEATQPFLPREATQPILPYQPGKMGEVLIAESPPEVQIASVISECSNALAEAGGMPVVPDYFYSARDFREEYKQRLAGAKAFVQIIGTRRFPITELFPEGYDRWQLQQAQSIGIPILRWRSPGLDLSTITDPEHRRFVTDDVVSCIPEEFKRHLQEWLKSVKPKPDQPVEEAFRILLVNHHQSDADVAELIGRESQDLVKWLQVCVCDDQRPLAETLQQDPVAGFVVVYAKADEQWVLKQLDDCWQVSRDIALKLKRKPPQRAIYVVKDEQKKPLRRRAVDLKVLDGGDDKQLRAFVASLENDGGAK